MNGSNSISPSPTDLIDWMNDEGLLELDWDFPENGDLRSEGLDAVTADLLAAIEDQYGVEILPKELKAEKSMTPAVLAGLIAAKQG